MPMMIAFDKLTYSPGSLVSGHVVITRKSPEKVKGLTMRFIGRSSKILSEAELPVKNYKKEVYFDEKMDIFGHDGTNTLLKVGETHFPFTFNLPHGLPSSFMWSRGNILYFVEAKLTRSSWKDDKRISCRLNVEGLFDLNLDPLAPLPAEIKRHKYVQHLLSKSGPLGFTFKITRSGFVRGHTLPFHVEIKNLSKIDAKKLKVSLIQEVNQDGKLSSSMVEQMKGPGVHSGEIQSWEARLRIPADIPPSNLGNLLNYPVVVQVQYYLHIELSLKSASGGDPLSAKLPVTIGTIALLRSRDRYRLLQLQQLQLQGGNCPQQQLSHDQDCPLSQQHHGHGTSQFSPNSLPTSNTPTSHGFMVQSSVIVTPTTNGGQLQDNPPVLLPLHRSNGSNNRNGHHIMGPMHSHHPHLFNPNGRHLQYCLVEGAGGGRLMHRPMIAPCFPRRVTARHHRELRLRESPPPSYDEVVGEDHPERQDTTLITTTTGGSSGNAKSASKCDDEDSSSPSTPDIDHEELHHQDHGVDVMVDDECHRSSSDERENEDPNYSVPVPQLQILNNNANTTRIAISPSDFSSSSSASSPNGSLEIFNRSRNQEKDNFNNFSNEDEEEPSTSSSKSKAVKKSQCQQQKKCFLKDDMLDSSSLNSVAS